jgi:rod shape-determining protein MreD
VVFVVFTFLFLGIELSLRNVLVLRSLGNIAPSFIGVLAVFVALFAPRSTALWAAWILGLLLDLSTVLAQGEHGEGPLIGPHALGYPFGCFLLLQIRPMLLRGRALTLAVMTTLFLAAATLLIVFVYAVHGWYPNEHVAWADLRPIGELFRRLGIAVYSGLLALALSPVLAWTIPVWSFRGSLPRGAIRRV